MYNTFTFLNRKEYFLGADQMIKLISSSSGKTIHTDLTPQIEEVLETEGIPYFMALQSPLTLSDDAFNQIDALIS